jgi:hypothetical protein
VINSKYAVKFARTGNSLALGMNREEIKRIIKNGTMKKIVCTIISLICFQVAFSQCLGDYYVFYTFPVNSEDSLNWEKLQFHFYNASDLDSWTLTYEYVEKGEEPTGATLYQIIFNEQDEYVPVDIELNIEHGQKYDLYICGEFVGEFQDAHSLLELDEDFEYQKNRLYLQPFSFHSDAFIPGGHIMDFLKDEPNNSYLLVQDIESVNLLPIQREVLMECSISIKPSTNSRSYYIDIYKFSIEAGGFEGNDLYSFCCDWTSFEEDVEVLAGFGSLDYNTLSAKFLNNQIDPNFPFRNDKIDNIVLRTKGERIEICVTESTLIYGESQSEEGIYLGTLIDSSGGDSIVATTLIHHPPLFVDDLGNDKFSATGYWDSFTWYNCVDSSEVATGKEFQPIDNGSYFVVASDLSGCSDTSTCFGIMNIDLDDLSEIELAVYPNPTSGIVQIDYKDVLVTSLELVDLSGRLLKQIPLEDKLDNTYSLDMSGYSSGVYFIKLWNASGEVFQEKFVLNVTP